MENGLQYSCGNESLDAIVSGLDIQPDDVILAVAGSGDQPLALLERAAKVIAVDINPVQIELLKKRLELLKKGDYNGFLSIEERGEADGCFSGHYMEPLEQANRKFREKYFMDRFGILAKKIGNLEVLEPMDVLRAIQERSFSKAYLSNVLGFESSLSSRNLLYALSERLPINGLVYVSNHDDLVRDRSQEIIGGNKQKEKSFIGIFDIPEANFLPSNMTVDGGLTRLARSREGMWRPAIYRKVNP